MSTDATVPEMETVIGVDLYDDSYEDGSRTVPTADPVSDAVGSVGYVQHFVLDDCVREFADNTWTEPERFDRFYFVPQVADYDGLAPLLIDVIVGDSPEEKRRSAERMHIAFKRQWIADNVPTDAWGRPMRYVTIDEADQWTSAAEIRAKLAPADPESQPEVEPEPDTGLSDESGLTVIGNPTPPQEPPHDDDPPEPEQDLPPAAESPQEPPQAAAPPESGKVQRPRRQRTRRTTPAKKSK